MTQNMSNVQDRSFFNLLRERVDHYFAEHQLYQAGDQRLYFKGILMIASAAGLYGWLVFFTPLAPVAIGLCILLGLNLALIGFNVMHEGGHQSFSRHHWVNRLSAYFLNILGGNAYYWRLKHNIAHHTHTNVEGLDSDIDVRPFMRLHSGQSLRKYHRFQHIYWVVLYGVSYLVWIFYEDFYKYFTGQVSPALEKKKLSLKEHMIFWLTKLGYMTAYMVIPMIVVGWLPWLVGFLVITFTCGLAISIVFQLAHVVEGTAFYTPDARHGRHQDWAVQQVSSTANFATASRLMHWLLGGLNFQIEHHLFPRISHIHYPEVSRIVRQTCEEFDITYHEYTSMFNAIVSHLMHLRRLGRA